MRRITHQLGMAIAWLLLAGAMAENRAWALLTDEADAPAATAAVDRVFFNQDLYVPKSQMIHDATCIFCSVQVEGDVTGRVLVLFGNLSVTGEIRGRTVVVGGNAVFDGKARAMRSTTVLFGNLVYETEEVLSGSAYVLGGHTSSYATRQSLRRRLAVSPSLAALLALLGVVLLVGAGFGLRRRQAA